ncbi:MAG: 1,4-alpha-glucan branching protein domain-containing protein, partial [Armatimonadota bacterium]
MSERIGCLSLVLHSHVPYVLGHGTWPHGAEMLYEAAAETYMPLIRMLEGLLEEGIQPKITIGVTPVVAEQLGDSRFKDWFPKYLQNKIDLACDNEAEFAHQGRGHLQYLAGRWRDHYVGLLRDFQERYSGDLLAAFAGLQERGCVELLTSAATHGYLPLLREDASVQAQVRQGVRTYERSFGRRPRGFWLPECAYRPRYEWRPPASVVGPDGHGRMRKGVEEFLAENGLDYCFVDSDVLHRGEHPLPVHVDWEDTLGKMWGRIFHVREPRPYDGDKSPYMTYFVGSRFEDHPPVAIFVRDPRSSMQVWSGEHGYPGDSWYLDFHKKHFPGGHRYWRVTDGQNDMGSKQDYSPEMAEQRVRENAGHFLWMAKEILRHDAPHRDDRPPVLCAPFDAELFGHWWFEGIRWLEHVLRWTALDPEIEPVTCSEYLERYAPATAIALSEGSWGQGGDHWVWLNEGTEWTWRRVYDAESDMNDLALRHAKTTDPTLRGILQQAARELLLLQASDWQFLITTWTARDYAEARAH